MNDQFSADFVELDKFLREFASNMSWARRKGIVRDEFFTTTKWNRENVAHSRINALVAKTGFDLDYEVEVETGFKPVHGNQFKVDVRLWKSGNLWFLIEYESTNSADGRILGDEVQHYEDSLANDIDKNFPEYWLIIYTFPDSAVNSSDWNAGDYLKRDWKYLMMINNPHKFYKKVFINPQDSGIPRLKNHSGIHKYTENEDWNGRKIFLINLTVNGLEIDFPERFNKRYYLEATTE